MQVSIPPHAQRPAPRADATMRKAEALARFPRGTSLVRETRDGAGNYKYVWGAVRNFYSPYWRVCYEDDQWEDMTSTQLQAGMRLAAAVQDRAERDALTAGRGRTGAVQGQHRAHSQPQHSGGLRRRTTSARSCGTVCNGLEPRPAAALLPDPRAAGRRVHLRRAVSPRPARR